MNPAEICIEGRPRRLGVTPIEWLECVSATNREFGKKMTFFDLTNCEFGRKGDLTISEFSQKGDSTNGKFSKILI